MPRNEGLQAEGLGRYPGCCAKYGAENMKKGSWIFPLLTVWVPPFMMTVVTGNGLTAVIAIGAVFCSLWVGDLGFKNADKAHAKLNEELRAAGVGLSVGARRVRKAQLAAYFKTVGAATAISMGMTAGAVALDHYVLSGPAKDGNAQPAEQQPSTDKKVSLGNGCELAHLGGHRYAVSAPAMG